MQVDAPIRVSDIDVRVEIVQEGAIVEVELLEIRRLHVNLYLIRAEDQPHNEDGDAEKENDGKEEFEERAEKAAGAAAAGASADAVGGLARGDSGAVVSSVESLL